MANNIYFPPFRTPPKTLPLPYTLGSTKIPFAISCAIVASGTVHCAKSALLSPFKSTLTMFPKTTLPAAFRCVKSVGLRLYSVASLSPMAFR